MRLEGVCGTSASPGRPGDVHHGSETSAATKTVMLLMLDSLR